MTFKNNTPSLKVTIVGFGQAGTRMADLFANVKTKSGEFVYNTLALNSNDGDLRELKYIPSNNQLSLQLGGLGKNPEKAISILEENQEVRNRLKEFITERIADDSELVLFVAGLGGGTGTSTIVKAIEEFYDFNNKPKITAELKKIQANTTPEDFRENLDRYKIEAYKIAKEKFIKIGVVATLPVRSDGPDVLRQVNDFANRIWKTSLNEAKGIAFAHFPDNQHLYNRWKELGANSKADNYRDFANLEVFEHYHEIFTATNGGGTSITFDKQDFKRAILEGVGSFVISKVTRNIESITNSKDLEDMFSTAVKSNSLHDPIQLIEEQEGRVTRKEVHHMGLLAVIDKDLKHKQIGSSFLDNAKDSISSQIPLRGTIFSGYLEEKNEYNATVYTFYKAKALPNRLSKGLVEEYMDYEAQRKNILYSTDTIAQIAATSDDDFDIEIDLEDLGITIEEPKKEIKDSTDPYDIDVDSIDFDDLKID